jgi:hypothetical protein
MQHISANLIEAIALAEGLASMPAIANITDSGMKWISEHFCCVTLFDNSKWEKTSVLVVPLRNLAATRSRAKAKRAVAASAFGSHEKIVAHHGIVQMIALSFAKSCTIRL